MNPLGPLGMLGDDANLAWLLGDRHVQGIALQQPSRNWSSAVQADFSG